MHPAIDAALVYQNTVMLQQVAIDRHSSVLCPAELGQRAI